MELSGITLHSIFEDNQQELKLIPLVFDETNNADIFDILTLTKASSAADLVGHLNPIHPNRIQILGSAEIGYYESFSHQEKYRRWNEFLSLNPPLLVIAENLAVPSELQQSCIEHNISLLLSKMPSATIIDSLRMYLSRVGAPRTTMHGVFMDIFGMGVLIAGDSGLGKSELGLELVTRGHGLVADDAIDFACLGSEFIEGRCPPLLQNLLEVRGIGILDIRSIFGETAVRRKMKLKLIINLIRRNDAIFERIPFEIKYQNVLEQKIRILTVQIAAGRNMAVIVEAAVRNTILQMRGINTLEDFMQKQQDSMNAKTNDINAGPLKWKDSDSD
jgi:HPr kinase/phosphorylase